MLGPSLSLMHDQPASDSMMLFLYIHTGEWKKYTFTLMCLSIGTPKNNKFSICSKWKIRYF